VNVNFLYDDIVHVLHNTIDSCINIKFRSHKKDGGEWSHHSIYHSQKLHVTCKPHGSLYYRTGVMNSAQSFTVRDRDFQYFLLL